METTQRQTPRTKVSTAKTQVLVPEIRRCIIHNASHSLNDCREFRSKSLENRRKLLSEQGLCFKCLESKEHRSRNCTVSIKCETCGSTRNATGMHSDNPFPKAIHSASQSPQHHGGEKKMRQHLLPHSRNGEVSSSSSADDVDAKCTEICKGTFGGRPCAKIVPVDVYHYDYPNKSIKTRRAK